MLQSTWSRPAIWTLPWPVSRRRQLNVYQWVAIGLGAPLPTHQDLFKEATARYADSYQAHTSYVHASAPKWYGTTIGAMLDFAAQAADRALPGRVLGTVLTDAVIEALLDILSFSEDSKAKRVAALVKLAAAWDEPLIASRSSG